MIRPLALVCLLALAVVLAGCAGTGSTPTPTGLEIYYYWAPTPPTPATFTATVGDQVQLVAFGTYANTSIILTSGVTWGSENPTYGTVSSTGLFTAKAAGPATLTLNYHSLPQATLLVNVVAPGPQPTANLSPFAQGSIWQYTGTEVSVSAASPEVTETITVTRQVVLDAEVWWELQIQGTDITQTPTYTYMRNEGQGLAEYISSAQTNWRLKEPLTVGNSWSDPSDSTHTWTITSLTASVTVPAGSYTNCAEVLEVQNVPGYIVSNASGYNGTYLAINDPATQWYCPVANKYLFAAAGGWKLASSLTATADYQGTGGTTPDLAIWSGGVSVAAATVPNDITAWFAPGVGLVKNTSTHPDSTGPTVTDIEEDLLSAHLK
jgi:hypothetical protein